jgi:peptide/nickel transport system permease protein
VAGYIVRRLIQAVMVLILVSGLVFFIIRMLPGDPVVVYMTQQQISNSTPEQIAAVRHEFGLDRPSYIQYITWVSGLLHGDLGDSIAKRQPVTKILRSALPISLYLGILAFVISNIIAIPAGVVCAARRGKWIDTTLTVLANIGITAPIFWVGILLIYTFSVWLHWLPSHGYTSVFTDFGLSTRQLIMPVFCLTLFPLAATVRQTRSAMLEVIRQDYIRTAWSKGLRERVIISRHALKNGLLPVVTLAGMSLSNIVGGEVLIETVFSIPGVGYTAVNALLNLDYAIVQGVVLVVAAVVVTSNLMVDVSYGWLDPRITYA